MVGCEQKVGAAGRERCEDSESERAAKLRRRTRARRDLPAEPEFAVIQAGTLNHPSWLSPTLEIWCGSAQPMACADREQQAARPRPAGLTGQLLSRTATSGFWGLPRPSCSVAVAPDGQLEIAAPRFFRKRERLRPLKWGRLERCEMARLYGADERRRPRAGRRPRTARRRSRRSEPHTRRAERRYRSLAAALL